MMPDEKRIVESCMRVNGYDGQVTSLDRKEADKFVYHIKWSNGGKYLVNIDKFSVNEMREDDVGEN